MFMLQAAHFILNLYQFFKNISDFHMLVEPDESTITSGTLGNEDLYITWTCSTPPPVLGHPQPGGGLPPIIAMSVESTIIRVLKALEVSTVQIILCIGDPKDRHQR